MKVIIINTLESGGIFKWIIALSRNLRPKWIRLTRIPMIIMTKLQDIKE